MGEYLNTRIWKRTLHTLRLIAAMTDSSIVQTIDRLANEEFKRLKEQEQKEQGSERQSQQ